MAIISKNSFVDANLFLQELQVCLNSVECAFKTKVKCELKPDFHWQYKHKVYIMMWWIHENDNYTLKRVHYLQAYHGLT